MEKKTKYILIGAGAAITVSAIAGGMIYSAVNDLVKVAIDREIPKRMKKTNANISGENKDDELTQMIKQSTEALRNSELETIEIRSFDGERLTAHWYGCENAKRIIIAMHGWRSSWAKDFGGISEFLRSNGCSVLYAEQRGQNNSGGEYMGFGLIERYDCFEWIKWVNQKCGEDTSIYLAGVSMGATTVLMTAGLELPSNVCGIIADCGFTNPYEIWKYVADNNLHMSYAMKGNLVDNLCRKKIQMSLKDYSCIDAMKECKVPVLFIHGTDDKFVPVEMTYENYKACTAPKRLFIVPGATHAMSYWTETEKYENELKRFWTDCDKKIEEKEK